MCFDTCAALRIFALIMFDIQQQFCIGWKLLSGEEKAAKDVTDQTPAPTHSHPHSVLWEAKV